MNVKRKQPRWRVRPALLFVLAALVVLLHVNNLTADESTENNHLASAFVPSNGVGKSPPVVTEIEDVTAARVSQTNNSNTNQRSDSLGLVLNSTKPIKRGGSLHNGNLILNSTKHIKRPKGGSSHTGPAELHIVCSSDCTPYQRWQVITQAQSARAVGSQVGGGKYTWLVSGCGSGSGEQDTRKAVAAHFPDPAHRPELHFTPDFSDMSVYGGPFADGLVKRTFKNRKGKVVRSPYGNRYHFNNKPNSLRHWAEHRFGKVEERVSSRDNLFLPPNEAIVLIDPDFMFMRRLDDASEEEDAPAHQHQSSSSSPPSSPSLPLLVRPGFPAAQSYGLGDQWLSFNLTDICGAGTPCTRVTSRQVYEHFSAGPPYVIHAADILTFSTEWARLVPRTYDHYPMLYAEMFAYSMAAAQLGLKHKLLKGLMTGCMVGWPKVTNDGENKIAFEASVSDLKRGSKAAAAAGGGGGVDSGEQGAPSCFSPGMVPPPFLHYCQHYQSVSGEHFGKRAVPHGVLDDCGQPASPSHSTHGSSLQSQRKKSNKRRSLLQLQKNKDKRSDVFLETSIAATAVNSAGTGAAKEGKEKGTAKTHPLTKMTSSTSSSSSSSIKRDHATGAQHTDTSLGWNALAYCAVTRGIHYARKQGCLFSSPGE